MLVICRHMAKFLLARMLSKEELALDVTTPEGTPTTLGKAMLNTWLQDYNEWYCIRDPVPSAAHVCLMPGPSFCPAGCWMYAIIALAGLHWTCCRQYSDAIYDVIRSVRTGRQSFRSQLSPLPTCPMSDKILPVQLNVVFSHSLQPEQVTDLAGSGLPILVIIAKHDTLIPVRVQYATARRLNAHTMELDSGHMMASKVREVAERVWTVIQMSISRL